MPVLPNSKYPKKGKDFKRFLWPFSATRSQPHNQKSLDRMRRETGRVWLHRSERWRSPLPKGGEYGAMINQD